MKSRQTGDINTAQRSNKLALTSHPFLLYCPHLLHTVFRVMLGVIILLLLLFSISLLLSGVCLLEVDEGPCRGNIERYYYNTITQKCEVFYYGGCQGNANNFKSYQECHKTCYKIPKVPPICRVPKDEGPCRALLPSYFFNMTTMQCEPFSYGGCQGNSNRFQNLASCMEYCSPKKFPPVLCREPLDKGKCSASITRYYYNAATKMCEEFVYSGCGGSNNNFVSLQGCMDVCGKGYIAGTRAKHLRVLTQQHLSIYSLFL
uniref:Tissue factor pathway inhibitor 2 n=1 Tax=Amphilophus citrinellus TaxID=61819 RepID=A0A3Q0QPY7_AMPCI